MMKSVILSSLVVLLFAASAHCQYNSNCKDVSQPLCTISYLPPYSQRQFKNRCEFEYYNMWNPLAQYFIVSNRACFGAMLMCSTYCESTYSPICAVPITNMAATPTYFDNECKMINHNCNNFRNAFIKTLVNTCASGYGLPSKS